MISGTWDIDIIGSYAINLNTTPSCAYADIRLCAQYSPKSRSFLLSCLVNSAVLFTSCTVVVYVISDQSNTDTDLIDSPLALKQQKKERKNLDK